MKLARAVYGKEPTELTTTAQGELEYFVAAKNLHSVTKWKKGYFLLKDNFLFMKGNSKNVQITYAFYLNTLEAHEFTRAGESKPFCFSVDTNIFAALSAQHLSQWLEAFRTAQKWFEIDTDEVSQATVIAYNNTTPRRLLLSS
jgi:hypothetical protein